MCIRDRNSPSISILSLTSLEFGPIKVNKSAGATVIGCREFLIAYNINLNTPDKRLATDIAFEIREAGRSKRKKNPHSSNLLDGEIIRHKNGAPIKVPGKFKFVKAIGWYVSEYNRAQVSINFTNYKISPIHQVFDTAVSYTHLTLPTTPYV